MTSLAEIIRRCRSSIWEFARYLGVTPYSHQAVPIQAVEDATYGIGPRKIGITSGKGPGKTFGMVLGSSWRTVRPGPGTLTVVSSPSMRQCQTIYLAEAKHILHGKGVHPYFKNLFDIQGTRIVLGGGMDKNWIIICATATAEENMAGYHNPHLSFFLDECTGIDDPIFNTIQSTCTHEDYLIYCAGNPTQLTGWFVDYLYEPKHRWIPPEDRADAGGAGGAGGEWLQLRFDCEEISKIHPELIRPSIIAQAERDFGRHSDYFRVMVKGLPPNKDPRAIIAEDRVRESMRLHEITDTDCTISEGEEAIISIDFAAEGDDEAVIGLFFGRRLVVMRTFRNRELYQILDEAFALAAEHRLNDKKAVTGPHVAHVRYRFDAIGVGAFAIGECRKREVRFEAFKGNSQAVARPDVYENRIAEAYYELARALNSDQMPLLLPDSTIRKQLTTRFGRFTPSGTRLMLEDKTAYKRRMNFSPDRADMVVMGLAPGIREGRSVRAGEAAKSSVERKLDRKARGQSTVPSASRTPSTHRP